MSKEKWLRIGQQANWLSEPPMVPVRGEIRYVCPNCDETHVSELCGTSLKGLDSPVECSKCGHVAKRYIPQHPTG